LKPVSKGLARLKWELAMSLRAAKVDFIPSEKNVLLSFWYHFDYFKVRRSRCTVDTFLDDQVVYIKEILEDPKSSRRRRQLYLDLFNALHHPRLLKIIITFLESSPPEEHYLPVVEAMKRAWRDNGEEVTVPGETQKVKEPEQPDVPSAGLETGQPTGDGKDAAPPGAAPAAPSGDTPALHAKTYYIAAELHFELAGQQAEYQVLCRQLPELAAFVQEKFGVTRLPGRFKEFKGYSYKAALKDHNTQKKGQLKPLFRQIAGNPRVFGEAIAGQAREILAEHFN